MSDNGENSAKDPTKNLEALKAEKRKLKEAITRQLKELAGRIAGVSGGLEPRCLEESLRTGARSTCCSELSTII